MTLAIKNILITVYLSFLASHISHADQEVAFFQYRDSNGNAISFEEDGQFFHSAIKTKEGWLHASVFGVQLVQDIKSIHYPLAVILKNKALPAPIKKQYTRYLNLPFDSEYTWETTKKTYCSKLIANILKIPALPMKQSAIITPYNTLKLKDTYGISPDDLFEILTKEMGFNIQQWQCSAIL